ILPSFEIGRAFGQATGAGEWGFEVAFLAILPLMAVCLGIVVACGLHTARSCVPGGKWLRRVCRQIPPPARVPPRGARPAGGGRAAGEMVPARVPEGRGDEPSPSGLLSAGIGGDA